MQADTRQLQGACFQYAVKLCSLLEVVETRHCEKFSTQEAMAEVLMGMGKRRTIEGKL